MADKQTMEFTASMKAEAAAAYLEALAAGLRAGSISLQSGSESAYLDVAPDVTLDIEAESTDKGKSTVDVSLTWRIDKRPQTQPPTLMISSDPAPPEPEPTSFAP
jgi:amphi-Trp domain-containing protein